MKTIFAIVLSAAMTACAAVDVVLGKVSDLSWTGMGVNKVASWRSADVLEGLAAWWKMDEASWSGIAGEVKDSVGSYDATSIGNAGTVVGKIGRAGSFGLFGDKIESAAGNAFNAISGTISMWIKPNWSYSDSSFAFFFITYGGDGRFITMYKEGGRLNFYSDSTYRGNDFFYMQSATWYHIAIVWPDNKIFVNGNEEFDYADGGLGNGFSHIVIGDNTSGEIFGFNGLIDDFRVYNRALSSNEVATIYNLYK